jgi:hypothetical protein
LISPYIANFVNYKANVGTEACHVIGLPGTGKSNIANLLFTHCMKQGNYGIVHGDRFCEWRHFLNYPKHIKEILILIPEELSPQDTEIVRVPQDIQESFVRVNFQTLDFTSTLKPHRVVVVYDACYDIASQAWLWVKIFDQMVNRKLPYCDNPLTYLNHEAGVLFPEIALSETKLALNQWLAVNTFCEQFVFFRKALIRPILVSQIESEMKHQIRLKCMWQVYRQGRAGRGSPDDIKMAATRLRLDQFSVVVGGGLYSKWNKADKFREISTIWKMIPQRRHLFGHKEPNGKALYDMLCTNCEHKWKKRSTNPKTCPICRKRTAIPRNFGIVESPQETVYIESGELFFS